MLRNVKQVLGGLGVVATPLGVAAGPAAAEATKIAVINSQRIFSEYQDARDAEALFKEEMRGWQQEITELERELIQLQEQIQAQALLRTPEAQQALQQDYQRKLEAYEQRKAEIFDPDQGRAMARNAELSAPINDQITTVVERLAAEGDYDLIIDVATVNVAFLAEGVDITDRVLEELGKTAGTEE